MIRILDYVLADDIRLLLGVSDKEYSDLEITSDVLTALTEHRLRSVSGILAPAVEAQDLVEHFETIDAIAEGDRTQNQEMLYNLIRSLAAHFQAYAATTSQSMASPKTKADGKGTLTRFSPETTFRDVRTNILAGISGLLSKINSMFDGYASGTSVYFDIIVPGYNPVTGL